LYFADQKQCYFGLAVIFLPGIAAVFVSCFFLSHIAAAILGMTLTLLTVIYSLRTLCTLVPLERFPKLAREIILFFGWRLQTRTVEPPLHSILGD